MITKAGWYFCASHRDAKRRELHGHSYEVVVGWPGGDVVERQDQLKAVCARLDHKTLPDNKARAEDIVVMFREVFPDCVYVNIWRPLERLGVEWRL